MITVTIVTPPDCLIDRRAGACPHCGESFHPFGLGPHKARCPQRPTPPPDDVPVAEEAPVVAESLSAADLTCPDCGAVCGSRAGLGRHRHYCHAANPARKALVCPECGDTYARETAYDRHVAYCTESRHRAPETLDEVIALETHSCRHCGRPCRSDRHREAHEASCQIPAAPPAVEAAEPDLAPCPYCGKLYRRPRGLAVHVGRWHWREQLAEAAARPPQRQPRLPGSAPAPRPALQCCCLTCRGEFSARVIVQHSQACDIVMEDPTESPYACEFCGQRCRNQRGLSYHERMCPQNPDAAREGDWWAAMGLDPNERWEPPPPPAPNPLIAEAVLRPLDEPPAVCAHCRRSPCENPAVCGRHLRAAAQWRGVPAVTRQD